MRFPIHAPLLFFAVVWCITFALPAAAAPGELGQACLAGDGCNSGLSCRDMDAGSAVAKICTRTCTDTGPLSRECSAPTSCVEVPGVGNYCVDLTGATADPDWLRGGTAPSSETVPSESETNTNVPFTPAVPTLELPIPSFPGFSTLRVEGSGTDRYVDIPFVAEYILAIYRYALGIMVTLTMVMIVIGGLRWVTAAGNASTIGAAKETIIRAIMGLLIAFGSYTILFLINPELVQFRSIRVNLVTRVDADEARMASTRESTTSPEDAGLTDSPSPRRRGGRSAFVSCEDPPLPAYPECPFTLASAVSCSDRNEPRTREFKDAARARFGTGDVRTRIQSVANAAAQCGIHMGACIRVVESIIQTAGATARVVETVSSTVLYPLQAMVRECIAGGSSASTCQRQARERGIAAVQSAEGSDWPDGWISRLRPGDPLWVYNANDYNNPRSAGQHQAVYMGPSGGGYVEVVHGGYGDFVTRGRLCVSPSCNGVLTRIYTVE